MLHPHESALSYPLRDALPAPGTTIEIAPGVRWLRMALPFALDHINLWLLRDVQDGVEGWTIVDCGIADDDTRARWERIFERELQGLPVLRVIVTHMHPDHIGLAHWLTERWSTPARGPGDAAMPEAAAHARAEPRGAAAARSRDRACRLWISATDWSVARLGASQVGTGTGGERSARFYALHGLTSPEALDQVRARAGHYASLVPHRCRGDTGA